MSTSYRYVIEHTSNQGKMRVLNLHCWLDERFAESNFELFAHLDNVQLEGSKKITVAWEEQLNLL